MTGRQKGNDGPEKGRAPVSIAHGRSNPLDGVVAELQDVADGAEFDLPAHYVESAGTKWRLLRVYLDEKTGRQVAAYCGVDEAACIPE